MKEFLSLIQEKDGIRQAVHILKDMRAEKDGLPRILQLKYQIDNFFAAHGVKPAHRFIQNQELRIIDQGDSKICTLLHAFGVQAERAAADLPEVKQDEQFAGPLCQRMFGDFTGRPCETEQVRHRQVGWKVCGFRKISYSLPKGSYSW